MLLLSMPLMLKKLLLRSTSTVTCFDTHGSARLILTGRIPVSAAPYFAKIINETDWDLRTQCTNILAMQGLERQNHLIGEGIAVANGNVVVHAGSVNHDDHEHGKTGFAVDSKLIRGWTKESKPRVAKDARIMLFIGIEKGTESEYDVQVCISFTQRCFLVIMKR
jgi:hypothetical protein